MLEIRGDVHPPTGDEWRRIPRRTISNIYIDSHQHRQLESKLPRLNSSGTPTTRQTDLSSVHADSDCSLRAEM
jgi:hypothetical protein